MTQGSPTSESYDGVLDDAFDSTWRMAALQRQVTLACTTCLATTAASPTASHPGLEVYAVQHWLEELHPQTLKPEQFWWQRCDVHILLCCVTDIVACLEVRRH